METNNKQSKQLQQQSQADGLAYFQQMQSLQKQNSEQHLGRGTLQSALQNASKVNERNMTPEMAWFGCGIQQAIREDKQATADFLALLFAKMLHRMNEDHPWVSEEDAMEEVEDMMAFDPTWTIEDFALAMSKMAKGGLSAHNGRPSTGWVRKCQIAYNELKYEAREELARKAKVTAEADAAERAYYVKLGLPTSEERMSRPRTMAEFLSGHDKLSAADRAQMAQRDKERNG